jgi:coenzyme F420 hydrogenase subunit beta
LSATLCFLIEANGVDGVVQIGASENNPICNETTISTSYAQIADAAGSRYAPSSPLASIETLRGNGKRYAFVGKPCDIAALRALIELDPEYKDTFPYLLSFFCAGVPSLKGGEEVVRQLGVDLRSVVSFRYRGNGWPGRATATLEDGGARSMSYHDSWGGILSNYVQHRCKICVDGTGDAADIVFADAWESDERGYPIFEERDGKSLILVRTPKGQEVLDGALGGRKIVAEPFDIGEPPPGTACSSCCASHTWKTDTPLYWFHITCRCAYGIISLVGEKFFGHGAEGTSWTRTMSIPRPAFCYFLGPY